MRSIVWCDFDFGGHPALVLTSQARRVASHLVTVVPGQTTATLGLTASLTAGAECGLDRPTHFSFDEIVTVPADAVRAEIGLLGRDRERDVVAALARAFELLLPATDDDWA